MTCGAEVSGEMSITLEPVMLSMFAFLFHGGDGVMLLTVLDPVSSAKSKRGHLCVAMQLVLELAFLLPTTWMEGGRILSSGLILE